MALARGRHSGPEAIPKVEFILTALGHPPDQCTFEASCGLVHGNLLLACQPADSKSFSHGVLVDLCSFKTKVTCRALVLLTGICWSPDTAGFSFLCLPLGAHGHY